MFFCFFSVVAGYRSSFDVVRTSIQCKNMFSLKQEQQDGKKATYNLPEEIDGLKIEQ